MDRTFGHRDPPSEPLPMTSGALHQNSRHIPLLFPPSWGWHGIQNLQVNAFSEIGNETLPSQGRTHHHSMNQQDVTQPAFKDLSRNHSSTTSNE